MSVFLTAEWRKLMMVQYAIDPGILAPYLPHGVELDLFRDSANPAEPARCFVSLVGFLFDRVRVKGIAFPLHTRFPEVNLRFYVKRTETLPSGQIELRRGVVFVNEFVPTRNLAVAVIAKQLYEEPYRALPMRRNISSTAESLDVSYGWRTGRRWHTMFAAADPTPHPIAPASVEEFITEHYWGYTRRTTRKPAGRTSAYQVEHPRWQVYPIHDWKLDLDYARMYGPQWEFLTDTWADNVLLAEGSAVKIYTGSDLPLSAA
ncbi:hypothetical protein SAMN05421819_3687 [Bryocella elongata]|uniref:DUF2071 domain-containing protein n=1 Tax=Bryocella elongata TaxID=863522 RepID=A0A1H6BG95_9BACT|nr:DUF2071 domain-containing protein [Bryocella elongata]SEG59789.1 hypothetical protein SAMN05421819_3687 [Bryocella elongata]